MTKPKLNFKFDCITNIYKHPTFKLEGLENRHSTYLILEPIIVIFCAWPSRFSSSMVKQLQALHIAVGCFEVIQPLLLEKCGSIRQEVIQAITLELHHVSSHAGILINVLMYWLYWCVVIVFGIYYHWSRKTCWPCEIDWSTSSPACTNASYLQKHLVHWQVAQQGILSLQAMLCI